MKMGIAIKEDGKMIRKAVMVYTFSLVTKSNLFKLNSA